MIDVGKSILIVEDNPADFFACERSLRKAGLANPIVHCETGEDALDYFAGKGRFEQVGPGKPGVVLLDINLPGINGTDVLKVIKNDPNRRRIPVVMLTTSSDERDIELAYQHGANSYVQKPVDLDGFMQAIQRLKDYWFELVILPRN
ncbi:MAG: response regulator [Pseudomonadota bacterium]|jgi:two-component system, response regulator|nr:response regulator [Pseudomonadota bacterium]